MSGFAGSQPAYDEAYDRLWSALDWVEDRLRQQRFLVGDTITEADVRCSRPSPASTPSTTGTSSAIATSWSRCPRCGGAHGISSRPPGSGTVDFGQIKSHYYEVHRNLNPSGIVARGPDLSGWVTPHGREQLGGGRSATGALRGRPAFEAVNGQLDA